jgi:hypothetical protein
MTADPAAQLSWRVPSPAEIAARRRIFHRAVLVAVVFTLALFAAFKPAWWGLGFAVGAVAGALMFWWQRLRFRKRYGTLPANMHLSAEEFRWGSAQQAGGEIQRDDATAFRIEQAEDDRRTQLVLILRDGFESQPILLPNEEVVERVREMLAKQWSIDESPSPRSCPVGTRTLRLPVYTEGHPDKAEWHWEGSAVGLNSLAQALRSAAEELPLPPPGARPKVLEVVGTRRDGSELLIAVDRHCWLDEITIAGPPEQLRAVAASLEEALKTTNDEDFELELDMADDAAWSIHCHRRGE